MIESVDAPRRHPTPRLLLCWELFVLGSAIHLAMDTGLLIMAEGLLNWYWLDVATDLVLIAVGCKALSALSRATATANEMDRSTMRQWPWPQRDWGVVLLAINLTLTLITVPLVAMRVIDALSGTL